MTACRAIIGLGAAATLLVTLSACDDDMAQQPKDKTWHAAEPLTNGLVWPLSWPAGMVARDPPPPPPALSMALLQRGQQRYAIYCVACHAPTGDGNGMVVQRGFPAPPSLATPRIIAEPTQHYYDVITNGYGIMFSFAERIAPPDRWAIAAYIRALQRAEAGKASDVPPDQQAALR